MAKKKEAKTIECTMRGGPSDGTKIVFPNPPRKLIRLGLAGWGTYEYQGNGVFEHIGDVRIDEGINF